MNLHEIRACMAAPVIAGNEGLRKVHNDLRKNGKIQEASHMIDIIVLAECIRTDPDLIEQLLQLTSDNTKTNMEPIQGQNGEIIFSAQTG